MPKNVELFKNHQLPLARIKKIMKSDEDVRVYLFLFRWSLQRPLCFSPKLVKYLSSSSPTEPGPLLCSQKEELFRYFNKYQEKWCLRMHLQHRDLWFSDRHNSSRRTESSQKVPSWRHVPDPSIKQRKFPEMIYLIYAFSSSTLKLIEIILPHNILKYFKNWHKLFATFINISLLMYSGR